MTNAITITRHFSGFRGHDDRFQLGDYEHEGNATVDLYALPDGYSVDHAAGALRDPSGILCTICADEAGRPVVMSLAGTHSDTKLSPV